MNPLRILHIDTERTWRGGQQQVFSLIQGLVQKRHFNFAVTHKAGPLAKKLTGICEQLKIRQRGEFDFISAHFVNRYIKSHSINIVHAHSGHGAALAAISTIGTKVPVVITRRVDFPVGKNLFSRWKYNRSAHVVAISQRIFDVLTEGGIPDKKISLIPSGVDFIRYSSVHPVSKEQMGFSPDSILIGQVAALAPHKDQFTFLSAIKIMKAQEPKIKGVIIGEGPLRKELEDFASDLGLNQDFKFLGFQENPLDYLASFDLFCLSSQDEGLGTSLLDAMALKVPVVATKAGGIPELIEDEVTGYLVPIHDPQKLAERILDCVRSQNKKNPIIALALEKAKKFDIKYTIDKVEALYNRIAR